jgi:nifR3 family TIM-barrel protein
LVTIDIGDIRIEDPVLLAPMSGITDTPFRLLARQLGAGLVVSEMIASRQLADAAPKERLRAAGHGFPLAVQLAGREAEWMARGAQMARDLGADIIDINMGCPAKQVTNGASGAALMRNLDHALGLIEAVIAAVDLPVTLKMRLGWDDSEKNARHLARRAAQAGIAMITVHGRTRCQFYNGAADWRAIAAVVDAVDVPVIANGDLVSCADADAMLRASGAAGVMIGRGACGQPWFPGQVAAHLAGRCMPVYDPPAQWRIADRHYAMMLDHYGLELGVRCARKHLAWYVEKALGVDPRHVSARHWRGRLCTSFDPAHVRGELERFYSRLEADTGCREQAA